MYLGGVISNSRSLNALSPWGTRFVTVRGRPCDSATAGHATVRRQAAVEPRGCGQPGPPGLHAAYLGSLSPRPHGGHCARAARRDSTQSRTTDKLFVWEKLWLVSSAAGGLQ